MASFFSGKGRAFWKANNRNVTKCEDEKNGQTKIYCKKFTRLEIFRDF